VNWNFQLAIHPDADQLSVFVEGATTSREHEQILAHLAECAECREAVFLMQAREETEPATRTPVKGWIWGRLLPVGLPAAALACGLVAVLVHIWPGDGPLRNRHQNASLREPEVHRSQTTVAPTTDSEKDQRSIRPKNSFAPNAAATGLFRQENPVASDLNLSKSKSGQAATNIAAPETTDARLSANAQFAKAARVKGGVSDATGSEMPLNGRNVTNLGQLQTPSNTPGAAAQNDLAKEKTLPRLEIAQEGGRAEALAGVSGRITDRSGATISGARISLRDAAGKTRQTTTSADGSFHLTELPAGRYELIATASGFKTIEQSIQLNPSQLVMLRPVLDTGTASEQVTVGAASAAVPVQTESANVGQVVAEIPSVGRAVAVPSGLPVTATVLHGKRFLSLDSTGNLFLSRNGGKKWKKINPQWTGKAVRIELTPAYSNAAPPKPKNQTLGKASEVAVFLLTTESGTVWTSNDGAHWGQQ
jgi:Carboxypeptidase regulatory-like domain/Putative zinc-finger